MCVSLVLPCLAHRQDVGVFVGADLQACASRLIGGTATRKCCVITAERTGCVQEGLERRPGSPAGLGQVRPAPGTCRASFP